MKQVESTADRYVRLLNERHSKITSSPEKARSFLKKIGLIEIKANKLAKQEGKK